MMKAHFHKPLSIFGQRGEMTEEMEGGIEKE